MYSYIIDSIALTLRHLKTDYDMIHSSNVLPHTHTHTIAHEHYNIDFDINHTLVVFCFLAFW